VIKSIKEIVREQLNAGKSVAVKKYRDAVLPIYGVEKNGRPSLVGTYFILEDKSEKYLITAAHVIDEIARAIAL